MKQYLPQRKALGGKIKIKLDLKYAKKIRFKKRNRC